MTSFGPKDAAGHIRDALNGTVVFGHAHHSTGRDGSTAKDEGFLFVADLGASLSNGHRGKPSTNPSVAIGGLNA